MYSDFHNDILTAKSEKLTEEYYDNNIITAVFRGKMTFHDALKLSERAKLLAFEDVGYADLDIEKLIKANPVYVGLTWNGENSMGYGCDYGADFGLKSKGKELISVLNENKIAVDCAHISKGGFKDIIDNALVVADSHTCFSSVYKHKRNLDEWQIREIINRDGIIGVACCGYFMTDEKHCKISDFIRQIDYFVQKFGCENLAIGTDFYGCDFTVENVFDYEKIYGATSVELKKLGYTENEIDKILFKNLAEFTKRSNMQQV